MAAEADVADQQGLSTFSSGRLIIEPDTCHPESNGARNKVYKTPSSENGLNTGQALDKAKLWCWVFSYTSLCKLLIIMRLITYVNMIITYNYQVNIAKGNYFPFFLTSRERARNRNQGKNEIRIGPTINDLHCILIGKCIYLK